MRKLYLLMLLLPFTAFAGTATLTWTAPTTNTDGSTITGPVTYKVYGALQGSAKALIASPAVSPFTHSAVPTGTFCYHVTAVVGTAESAPSNESCKVIPAPTPNPPVLVTVAVVAGVPVVPAYNVLASGARSAAVAGFVAIGKACSGAVVFTYRGKSYRRVAPTDVAWWQTTATPDVAAPCA